VHPCPRRTFVLLRRFVSFGPVALTVPPQRGQFEAQPFRRTVVSHRILELIKGHAGQVSSRRQRMSGLLFRARGAEQYGAIYNVVNWPRAEIEALSTAGVPVWSL